MLDYMKALLYPFIDRFVKDEEGQGMVEYALILVLVSIAAIAVLTLFGPAIAGIFQKILEGLTAPK